MGIVNNLSPCEPATDSDEDRAAAERADGHINRWWLDPIAGRGYPEDMIKVYGVDLPIQEGDLETIAAPLDYHGLNYYFRQIIADDPAPPRTSVRSRCPVRRPPRWAGRSTPTVLSSFCCA
ncbi:family 1 glycosylhydrolase [Streptosporangium lutulentum]